MQVHLCSSIDVTEPRKKKFIEEKNKTRQNATTNQVFLQTILHFQMVQYHRAEKKKTTYTNIKISSPLEQMVLFLMCT